MTPIPSEILIAREHDGSALRRALRTGSVEQLRRGAYRSAPSLAPSDRFQAARDQAVARVVAVGRQLADACISHESAALLHGLRLWRLPAKVHVVQGYNASSAAAPDIARHRVALGDHERTVIGGVVTTTLPRTVADCSATLHPLRALVIADHALATGMDLEAAATCVDARHDPRGRRRAQLVLQLADAGAESAWESWLRYAVLRVNLPRPATQLPIRTPYGTYRADLGWEDFRLLAEFDGRVKYRPGALGAGYDAERALFDEKRREDHLREEDWSVVRVTSSDTSDQAVARVARRMPESARKATRAVRLLPHSSTDRA